MENSKFVVSLLSLVPEISSKLQESKNKDRIMINIDKFSPTFSPLSK